MEPTDNLLSGYYGCPAAGTSDHQLFSPPSSSSLCLPSLPPAEELQFAGLENFGDWGQLTPLDGMPYIPAPGQFSPPTLSLSIATSDQCDEEEVQQMKSSLQHCLHLPLPPDGLSDTTNGAPAARSHADAVPPLVQRHGTSTSTSTTIDELQQLPLPTNGPEAQSGQFSLSNFSLSFTTSDQFDGEEVSQGVTSLQHFPHLPMVPDRLSNTTNCGPATTSRADAVLPLVQQGTSTTTDELPHSQQQLSLVDEEVQIQQMTPVILPSQPPSPNPMPLNPVGPDRANHAASTPMGLQAAPKDQEAKALTRRRPIKSRGLPSLLQDGSGNLFGMAIDVIRQLQRYIGEMMKEEKHRSRVWQHFWRSQCQNCHTVTVICQYCKTVIRDPTKMMMSTIVMLRHLESCECYHNIHLHPASSGASKETQRSSQTLQIKEIAENPNGESEPIESDNSNCASAVRVDTQGTNAGDVVQSPWQQQHQLLTMDREEQMATILSSQPCCQGPDRWPQPLAKPKPDLWWDLIGALSESSCCSSTAKSTHDVFRLKFSNSDGMVWKTVHVESSASWVLARKNPYKRPLWIGVYSDTSGNSSDHFALVRNFNSAPGFTFP